MKPTRDEILSEPSGPRLDEWLAIHVMGWSKNPHFDPSPGWLGENGCWNGWWTQEPPVTENEYGQKVIDEVWAVVGNRVWNPSTDIAAAWQVVDRLLKRFTAVDVAVLSIGVACCSVEQCTGEVGEKYVAVEEAETPSLAICRAALLAVVG